MSEFKAKVQVELEEGSLRQAESQIKNLGKNAKTKVDVEIDSKSVKNGKKVGEDIANQVKSGVSSSKIGEEINNQVSKGTSGLSNLNTSVNATKGIFGNLGTSIKSAFANYTGVGAITAGLYELKQVASEAKEAIEDINKATVDLQMATNQSYSEVSKMVGTYNKMGQNLGATTTEVTDSADAWLRQGKSMSETNTLIKDSMILSKVASIDSADSTQYLTSAMKGYKVATEDTLNIVDKLTSVDLVSATDAGGLAEGMSRTANSADLAGISMDKLLGYLATVGETTQKSMSSVGESFKSIFARMSDIKAGKLSSIGDDGTVENISNVDVVLSALGIKLRDSNQEFRNFGDVLDEVGSKWSGFSSLQQAAISKAFAGTRQAENFKVLMSNYQSASAYAETAANSEGQALEKFNYYADSIEAKKKSLQASFESLATNTFSSDAYGNILDTTKAIIDFTDKTGLLKTALGGLAVAGMVKGFSAIQTGIAKAATQLTNFSNALDIVKSGTVNSQMFDELQTITGNLTKKQYSLIMSSANLSKEQKMAMMTARGMSEAEAEVALATATANGSTANLSGTLKGMGATIAPLLPVILGLVAALGAFKVADVLNYTYDEKQSDYQNAKSKYDDTLSELESIKSSQNEVRSSLESLGEKYGVTFDQTDGIDTMISKLKKLNLTLEDQASLDTFTAKTEQLEKQLEIQTKVAEIQQKSAASAAKTAVNSTTLNKSAMKAESVAKYGSYLGGFIGSVKDFGYNWLGEEGKIGQVLNIPSKIMEEIGSAIGLDSSGQQAMSSMGDFWNSRFNKGAYIAKSIFGENGILGFGKFEENDKSALDTNLELVEKYQNKINELTTEQQQILNSNQSESSKTQKYNKLAEQIQNYSDAIAIAQEGLSQSSESLMSKRDSMVDSTTGVALSGFETEVKAIDASIARFNGNDLTESQKQLASIQDYFSQDSSSSVKEYLTDLASDSEKSASDIADAMESIGLSSSNFDGTSLKDVGQYFKDISEDAKKASESAQTVGNTLADMESAAKTDDSYATLNTYNDLITAAQELKKKGLTGTDDFETTANTIGTSSKKSAKGRLKENKKNFQKNVDTIHSYMDYNEDDKTYEVTKGSVKRFSSAFNDLDKKFETTGEAAKEMGMSTSTFEQFMDSMSDYDIKNSGIEGLVKSSERLSDAQSTYDKLAEFYDSIGDEDSKKLLDDEWTPMLEEAKAGLAEIPEEKITKLKFEYDKASLEQANEQNREKVDAGAGNDETLSLQASTIVNNDAITKSIMKENDISQKDISLNVDVSDAQQKVADLKKDLINAKDDESKIKIQADVDTAQQELNEMLESWDGKEFTVKAKVEESDAENKVDHLTSKEYAAQVTLLLGEDKATPYIEMFNAMSLDPKFAELSAKDQATAVYNAVNSLSLEDKQAILTGKDNASDIIESVISKLNTVNDGATANLKVKDNATTPIQQVSSYLTGLNGKTATTYIKTVKSETTTKKPHTGEDGMFRGTAHASGTAYASGVVSAIPNDALSNKKYRTPKDGMALTGELGEEIVVSGDHWYTIGTNGAEFAHIPANSIVFNHKQSKELLSKGFTNSRGKAHANGTVGGNAYASGKKTTALDNFSKWFAKLFDWAERKINKLEKKISNFYSKYERYLKNGDYKSAKSNLQSAYDNTAKQSAYEGIASSKYKSKANSVLSTAVKKEVITKEQAKSIKKKMAKGTLDVSSYSEKLRTVASDYQTWIEKSEDATYAVEKLKSQLDDYAEAIANIPLQEAEDKIDKINKKMEVTNAKKDAFSKGGSTASFLSKNTGQKYSSVDYVNANKYVDESFQEQKEELSANKIAYDKSVSNQKTTSDKIAKTADYILKKWKKKLTKTQVSQLKARKKCSTSYSKTGKKDSKLKGQVAGYNALFGERDKQNEAIATAKQTLEISQAETASAETDAANEKLENIQSSFESKNSSVQSDIDKLESRINKAKELGKDASEEDLNNLEDDYTEQAANYQKQKKILQDEKTALEKQLASSGFKEGSQEWNDWKVKIDDVTKSMDDCDISINDIYDTIRNDILFAKLDNVLKKAERLHDTLSSVNDLIKDEMVFNDDGTYTALGIQKLSSSLDDYNQYLKDIQAYQSKIDAANEAYNNGNNNGYSQKEYEEDIEKATSSLQDSVSKAQSAQSAITELAQQQMQKELDAINKVIDARSEALQKKKDYYDYDKTIKSKTKDIKKLQEQISALEGVDTAAAKAKRSLLESQLKDAQDDMDDTVQDHLYSIQVDGLSELKTELQDDYDDYVKSLSTNLDLIEECVSDATGMVREYTTVAKDAFEALLQSFGVDSSKYVGNSDAPSISGFASGGVVGENTLRGVIAKNGDSLLASVNPGETILTEEFQELLPDLLSYMRQPIETPQMDNISFAPNNLKQEINCEANVIVQGDVKNDDTIQSLMQLRNDISNDVINKLAKDARRNGIQYKL